MRVEDIITNTIHDTVADITGFEEETASAIINALAYHGYHIVGTGAKDPRPRPTPPDYPPNTKCVCGDLIHPDQPFVEVEAAGGLFHWNEAGGGHRADARLT